MLMRSIETDRLILRPWTEDDIPAFRYSKLKYDAIPCWIQHNREKCGLYFKSSAANPSFWLW